MGAHIKSRRKDGIREVMDHLRRIVQTLRVSSRQAEMQAGLTGAQLFVLSQLRGEKRLSVNELAERTATHQSSVSVVIDRLVEKGLIRRTPSPQDARRKVIELTAKGLKTLKSAPETPQEKLIEGLTRMKSEEVKSLAGLMSRWSTEIGIDQSPPAMFGESSAKKGGRR